MDPRRFIARSHGPRHGSAGASSVRAGRSDRDPVGMRRGRTQGLAAAGLLVLAALVPGCGGQDTRLLDGGTFSFRYPAEWQPLTLTDTGATAGTQLSSESVGLDEVNFATLAVYQLPEPVTENRLDDLEPEVVAVIRSVAEEAAGRITSGPTDVRMGGLPGFRFEITAEASGGVAVRSTLVLVFQERLEYFLNCQRTSARDGEMRSGCDQIMRTFRPRRS